MGPSLDEATGRDGRRGRRPVRPVCRNGGQHGQTLAVILLPTGRKRGELRGYRRKVRLGTPLGLLTPSARGRQRSVSAFPAPHPPAALPPPLPHPVLLAPT